MKVMKATAAAAAAAADAELAELYNATGIDLTGLPAIATTGQVAKAIGSSDGAMTQDRYRNRGIPYLKLGRRIRYSRTEVARYLLANHKTTVG